MKKICMLLLCCLTICSAAYGASLIKIKFTGTFMEPMEAHIGNNGKVENISSLPHYFTIPKEELPLHVTITSENYTYTSFDIPRKPVDSGLGHVYLIKGEKKAAAATAQAGRQQSEAGNQTGADEKEPEAENLAITDFHFDETDITANTTGSTVLDQNGDKCALIKIQTVLQGLSFDVGSLGVVKREQRTGEVWVYVPEGVKRISIHHPTLNSVNDYDLGQTLKHAMTYHMTIKGVAAPPKMQTLVVTYTPADATVIVNSKIIKGENGQASVELPANKEYKYMVMAEGYESMEGSVKLKVESRAHIRVELQPTE